MRMMYINQLSERDHACECMIKLVGRVSELTSAASTAWGHTWLYLIISEDALED